MGPRTPQYANNKEKDLIAEQPGRFVLFSGLLLAVVLGLAFRGLMAPTKVRSMIEAAASRMHKEVQVEFDSAQISLSRGLLPHFAVVITNVKMSSANECWMKPVLTVDELRLPLSLWAVLKGESPITQIQGGDVLVNLRSPYKNCQNNSEAPKFEKPALQRFVTLKAGTAPRSGAQATPQVKAISVDRLRVSVPKLAEPLELLSMDLRLKSHSPRVVELTAKTHLMKDEQVGDYLSHATVWGEYSEFPLARLQTRVSGNWREGSYHLKASYGMTEEHLATEVDLKHIPLSLIFQIFKKFHWLKEDFNGRQIWVSLNAQSSIHKSNYKAAEMQLKNLRLEGDLGDLAVNEARIVSLDPVKYFPFTVEIQRLSFDRLLSLFNRPHPAKTLGRLGLFDGRAEVTDQEHIQLKGVHRGLEFIFSNKGQRELQTLREFSTEMSLDKAGWHMKASRFVPDRGGVLEGQLQVNAPLDGSYFDFKGKATEIRLSSGVAKLMTAGGQLGAFSGELGMRVQDGQVRQLRGQLNSDLMEIEGVGVERLRMSFDTQGEQVRSQAQVQKLEIKVGSPAFQVLKDLIDPAWMSGDSLKMKNLISQFEGANFQAVEWKSFSAQLEKGGRLQSDGSWDSVGKLSGQVQVLGGKAAQHWDLGGFRDEPRFTPGEGGRKKKSP